MQNDDKLLERPLIFIGPGRSGSTIISEFVMAHEQLAWPTNYLEMYPRGMLTNHLRRLIDNRWWRLLGEKGQINSTLPLNNLLPRPAEAYPFWESLVRDGIDFSRGFLLGESCTLEERDRIRSYFSRMVRAQKRQRLSLKLTGPGRIGYLQSIFPDALFINVTREPAATIRSFLKSSFWTELGMHRLWWTGAYDSQELVHYEKIRHDPEMSTAFQLQKVISTTHEEARSCGVELLNIRYEDFVTDPSGVIDRILQAAGLPSSKWIERKLHFSPIHDRNRR
ncbi:MAG: sulfotransferase [Chromatiales bacterium]|jgi:hypothetical protein